VPTVYTLAQLYPGRYRPFKPEAFDCDDHAREFKAWMAKLGVTAVSCTKGTTPIGLHAFNLNFFKSSNTNFILFMEPQLAILWNIDRMEKKGYIPRKVEL